MYSLPESLISLRLFGSAARGQHDLKSDVDVLAVYAQTPSADERHQVKAVVQQLVGDVSVDLAEYSKDRILHFFQTGHLFSWHLYRESNSLLGTDFISEGLRPEPYREAISDTRRFIALVESSIQALQDENSTVVFEAGILYLASRNIAMCLSWLLSASPNFQRFAPFDISHDADVTSPFTKKEYEILVNCRFASTRGTTVTPPERKEIIELAHRIIRWGNVLLLKCTHTN